MSLAASAVTAPPRPLEGATASEALILTISSFLTLTTTNGVAGISTVAS